MRSFLPLIASLTLVALAPAQDCGNLSVNQNDSEVSFELTTDGGEGVIAIVAIGKTEGSTSIDFGPLGSLELGLAMPFAPLPIGLTDADGDTSRSFPLPAGVPQLDLFAQGVTAELTMGMGDSFPPIPMIGFDFCTSNVVGFQLN